MIKRVISALLIVAVLFSVPAFAASARAKQVVKIAMQQIGKPYKINANSPHSFNCASLVMYCYNHVKKGTITTQSINSLYKLKKSKSGLKQGDIVCFKTGSGRKPKILNYHFGIYCGKGYFIHAQRKKGVVRTKVKNYNGRYLGAIRVF